MKTTTTTKLIQTHHFIMENPGDKLKALEQVELHDLTVEYSDTHELRASKDVTPKDIEILTTLKKQSLIGCVVCGCRISLKGYCAGCQSRID